MSQTIAGIEIPDTLLARAATRHIQNIHSELLFNHAIRTYVFGALAGVHGEMQFNAELLYVAALFHNAGLAGKFLRSPLRFEIDSANEARSFLQSQGMDEESVRLVWTAIAIHTTPGIPEFMQPVVALLSAGVQMDVRGAGFASYSLRERDDVVSAFPREPGFKNLIIESYARGMEHRPETTFGTVNSDVLDRWTPDYRRINFCGLVLGCDWPS